MATTVEADFKSGLMFYFQPVFITKRPAGEPPFCAIDFGPKDGGRIALRFHSVDDIAELASALYRLGKDFAEKIGPDDAVVPIGWAEVEAGAEAAPITEPLIGGGVPRIEGEAEVEGPHCGGCDVCPAPVEAK